MWHISNKYTMLCRNCVDTYGLCSGYNIPERHFAYLSTYINNHAKYIFDISMMFARYKNLVRSPWGVVEAALRSRNFFRCFQFLLYKNGDVGCILTGCVVISLSMHIAAALLLELDGKGNCYWPFLINRSWFLNDQATYIYPTLRWGRLVKRQCCIKYIPCTLIPRAYRIYL